MIIGQNKLWKTGSDMGSAQNRRFHRLPHARWIEQVMIKAEAASIIAVCFEESHTSRTSFAAMEPLPSRKAKATPAKAEIAPAKAEQSPPRFQEEPRRGSRRSKAGPNPAAKPRKGPKPPLPSTRC